MSEEDGDRHRLYDILNIGPTASDADVRESHRRLSRLFHPDKHTSTEARAKADPKFQDIQYAFEVLSDPRQRTIYDTLGEEGLAMKMDLGQKNMGPDELKRFFQRQSKQARIDTLQSLVQNRGETSVSIDARSMFGGRVVIENHMRLGSPVPLKVARPATVQERLGDVMFRGMAMRNSWTIPFNISTLFKEDEDDQADTTQPVIADNPSAITFTTNATISARRQLANFGLIATLRHQLSSKTNLEASIPIMPQQTYRAKVIHQYSQEMFMTADVAASTLACPPDITVTTGRQITERGVLFATLRSGTPWKLAGWGESGNAASYIIGWTRNATPTDATGYTVELITGLQVLGVAADYNTVFTSSDLKFKAGGSMTTSGLAINFGASRRITEHARLGADVTANAQSLFVKFTFSRLGQSFKVPVWIGDGWEIDSMLYGVLLPLSGLIAYEFLVLNPRRQERQNRRKLRRRDALQDKLRDRERVAREAVELMTDAVSRKQNVAQSSSGLYIASATYGSRDSRIDVTIALAAQVSDGQLILPHNFRKHAMLGFWDPAYGEQKTLRVDYVFGGHRHFIEVDDKHGLALPSHSHLL